MNKKIIKIILISDHLHLKKALTEQVSAHGYELIFLTEEEFKNFSTTDDIKLFLVHEELLSGRCFTLIREISRKYTSEEVKRPIFLLTKKESLENRIRALNNGAQEVIELVLSGQLVHRLDTHLRPEYIWSGLKFVVVEDEEISLKLISHILRSRGAKVKTFRDGMLAFDYVKENLDIDLLMTDHMMPSISGIDFVKKIRNELGLKKLPVVFVSAIQDQTEILNFYKAGGNDYISKPIIKEELFVKVGQLINISKYSQMLNEKVSKLEEMDKLKDHFIAVCSHDLRGPLNIVLGLSNILSEDEEVSQEVREMASQIYSSSNVLLSMVNDLLDLSEVQMQKNKMRIESVNLCALIKDLINKNQVTNDKNIHFVFEATRKDVFVLGNDSLLIRLFQNLLSNAYKFTDRNGRIYIRVKVLKNNIDVEIEDTGIGMPAEFLDKIFEAMSGIGRRGTEGEKSTGIGMSIVKEIADNHGATIKVRSEVGVGTVFTVQFDRIKSEIQ